MCSCVQLTNKTKLQNEECEKSRQSEDDVAFVYNYVPPNAEDFNETLTIGFLGAYGQAQVVLGALPLAVMDVNRAKGNVRTYETDKIHADDVKILIRRYNKTVRSYLRAMLITFEYYTYAMMLMINILNIL